MNTWSVENKPTDNTDQDAAKAKPFCLLTCVAGALVGVS